ncbi:helix-turn-helix domain-containing protein [Antrihabitans sp. NCIMB 15449]|uniref:Helix-turn-helix domain-containing protein n=1 Tax=Antrihabitans spumae TaxID=3373370 RepID=A0ABW7JKX3_9NOCA
MLDLGSFAVDLITAYSKRDDLKKTYADLRKQIDTAKPRPSKPVKTGRTHALKRQVGRAEVDEIVAKYESGISTNQLMAEHHLAKRTIAALLKANGVTMRRQGLTDQDIDHAAILYEEGWSLAWIAANRFDGISPTTVSRALRRKGIQLRGRG